MSGGCPPAEAGSPAIGVGACATLACIWEATAPKPGNVYRGADFEDLTYAEFLASAAIIGPVLEQTRERGLGATVLEAVRGTRAAVQTNTNLGMLLLLAPLSAVPNQQPLASGIGPVLESLTRQDAEHVFEAIRLAQPGGLGQVDEADVHDAAPVQVSLSEAMHLAAERDLIALQYTNNFAQVFHVADGIEASCRRAVSLSAAIVDAYLRLLAEHPDSLVARKCGEPVARDVSQQAAAVLATGGLGTEAYDRAVRDFDFALRVDGHRRNPGTSADLMAAALFVLLRENRLDWPVRFYGNQESIE